MATNEKLKNDTVEAILKAIKINPKMKRESKEQLNKSIEAIKALDFNESLTEMWWHNMSNQDSAFSWINIAIDTGVSKNARFELANAISFLNAMKLS